MAENSKIQWTTHTFNPWRGCTKVSEGCKFCYAETLSGRNPAVLGEWGPNGTRVIAAEAQWREPVKWNRAVPAGERHRVFLHPRHLGLVTRRRHRAREARRRLARVGHGAPPSPPTCSAWQARTRLMTSMAS